jgi:hypothetical protein
VSSILVAGATMQAFKISLADFSLFVCHSRCPHNAENAVLACSRRIFPAHDLLTVPSKQSRYHGSSSRGKSNSFDLTIQSLPFEDALGTMGFVSLLFLDSADITAKVASLQSTTTSSSSKSKEQTRNTLLLKTHRKTPPAQTTLDVSLGQVDLYACRDSFGCLTTMIGEVSLFLTAMSEEQIEAAKKASSPTRSTSSSRGNKNTPLRSVAVPLVESDSCVLTSSKSRSADDDDAARRAEKEKAEQQESFERKALRKMILEGGPMPNPFADVPDSELSAKQLRQKHGIVPADEVLASTGSSSLASKSLLIKNYYTLDAVQDNESASTSASSSSSPIRRSSKKVLPEPNRSKEKSASESIDYAGGEGSLLLDGYDWTTVDHGWSRDAKFDVDANQRTEWFPTTSPTHANGDASVSMAQTTTSMEQLQIFPNHLAFDPVRDPLAEGDMNSAKLAGLNINESPTVQLRVFLRDLSLNCRFFDGHDWVLPKTTKASSPATMVSEIPRTSSTQPDTSRGRDNKTELLGQLLGHMDPTTPEEGDLFSRKPSPPPVVLPKMGRQEDKFFEFSVSGVRLRLDSFAQSPTHRLASCMDLKVMDFFLSESISAPYPAKLLGEWINEKKHPRDADDGMVMMKMMTMHPKCLVSSEGKVMNPESRVTLELLPLRAHIDQHALRFILRFFSGGGVTEVTDTNSQDADAAKERNAPESETTPERNQPNSPQCDVQTFFEMFFVKPCKLKVNYRPVGVDSSALREGSYAELLNLFSLEDMSLLLKPVEMQNLLGWGSVLSEFIKRWIEDICSTQLHKFISGATPFHPISNLGGGVADLVLMPVRHYKKDRNISRGLRKGTQSFAGTVAVEALNTTSKLTKTMARTLSKASPRKRTLALPNRPEKVPHTVGDTAQHALESLSRGIKTSTYMIVVVPRREYRKKGTTGAVKSVVRGIPVALLAPISGASEALSYTLVGMRNQMRPDIRREEEARHTGLRNRHR